MSETVASLLSNREIRAKASVSEPTYNHHRFLDKSSRHPSLLIPEPKRYILYSRHEKSLRGREFFGGPLSLFNVTTACIGLRKLERAFLKHGAAITHDLKSVSRFKIRGAKRARLLVDGRRNPTSTVGNGTSELSHDNDRRFDVPA
jgi:hypothetical protein